MSYQICQQNKMREGVQFGIVLVIAGVLFLLQHLGMLANWAAWEFWPLIIVISGLGHLFASRHGAGRLFGATVVLFGGLALAHTLDLHPVPWKLIWPIAIMGAGLVFIWTVSRVRGSFSEGANISGTLDGNVVMGSLRDRCETSTFDGGHVKAVLGEYDLDLTDAVIDGNEAHLFAKSVLAEIKVRVPEHWTVVVKGAPIMGSVENRTRPSAKDDGPTLVIHGAVYLGSIEIRN